MTTRRPRTTPPSSPRRIARKRPHGVTAVLFLALALTSMTSGCKGSMSLEEIRASQASGRFEETIEPLRKLLDATPDDPETQLLYGTALSRTGAQRVAIWSLRKAAESPAWNVRANLELASTQARSENWAAAIEAANAVIEIEPENLTAHLMRGESYLSEGKQVERALEDFDFVLAAEPMNFPAATSRASALLLLGRIDDAAKAIDELEALAQEHSADEGSQAQLCATQAVLRQERGKESEAEKRFDECLEQFPGFAIVIDPALAFFDAKGDPTRGNAILQKALELVPMSLSYRRTLAERLESAGNAAGALAVLKDGLKIEDREMRIALWTNITDFHVDRDELPEAIAAYEQALALVGDPPQLAILTYADLLARAGRHADAHREAEKLENKAYAGLIYARIALDEGNPKQALEYLDKVFPVWPNNAGARYYAARAAEQMGDFARAIEEYRQSIRSAPDQTEAALRLAKLYLAAGSYAEAWNASTQYIMAHRDDPEGARVMVASASRDDKTPLLTLFAQIRGTPLWPAGVAARAQFLAKARGPEAALKWIEEVAGPASKWSVPANAELLRVRLLLVQAAGRGSEADREAAALAAAHPESAQILEIQAALLEAKGTAPTDVLAAFERAVAKGANDWLALEGVARSREHAGDVPGAIEFYDRAAKAHPESPEAARNAARLVAQTGDKQGAEKRWADLLKEFPWDAETALQLAEIYTARKETGATTLDYAERAVIFGGGEAANKLLVRIHEARGEIERAREVAQALESGKPLPLRKKKAGVRQQSAQVDGAAGKS